MATVERKQSCEKSQPACVRARVELHPNAAATPNMQLEALRSNETRRRDLPTRQRRDVRSAWTKGRMLGGL